MPACSSEVTEVTVCCGKWLGILYDLQVDCEFVSTKKI